MNIRKPRNNLVEVIGQDLIKHNKLALLLLFAIVISAFSILIITQRTRLLLNNREQLLLAQDVLHNEWRNLILEENVLADQKRIEREAIQKLNMQYVTNKTESVIVVKKVSK